MRQFAGTGKSEWMVSSLEACWYFAYGSNMQRATFLERRGMKPSEWRRARLDDFEICFDLPVGEGERGVANLNAAPGRHVLGVLFRISHDEAVFLDRSEGVEFGVYERIQVSPTDEQGVRIDGFTYQSIHRASGRKPSPRYMGLILEGARQHGLPDGYIRSLEAFDLAIDERKRP